MKEMLLEHTGDAAAPEGPGEQSEMQRMVRQLRDARESMTRAKDDAAFWRAKYEGVASRVGNMQESPPPPSRTNWTRRVPPPVLTGHVNMQESFADATNSLELSKEKVRAGPRQRPARPRPAPTARAPAWFPGQARGAELRTVRRCSGWSRRRRTSCSKSSTRRRFASSRSCGSSRPPPPSSRTKWTRRVPHPVLIGHAASLSQEAQAARLRPAERPRQRALDDWRLYADRSGPAGGADAEGDESVPQTGEVDTPPGEAQVDALSCARSLAHEVRPCRAAPRPCGGACGAAPGAAGWGAVPWWSRSSGVMRGHGAVASPRPAVFEFREGFVRRSRASSSTLWPPRASACSRATRPTGPPPPSPY